mgnify:CR=1 FL=1
MDSENNKNAVYVKTDLPGCIIDINSDVFLPDTSGWVKIDEGVGSKYRNPQTNYFSNPIWTEDGIARYKLVDGSVVDRTQEEIASDRLPIKKLEKIKKSKLDLAKYLASHPLQWTDGECYSITAEKQAQLTSKVMAATMAQTLSTDYRLTWNSTGEVCKEWTLSDLSALAFAIDARVTSLVTYQQTQEVAINAAQTVEELESIEVDYDKVQ